jgi:hypothetical protein
VNTDEDGSQTGTAQHLPATTPNEPAQALPLPDATDTDTTNDGQRNLADEARFVRIQRRTRALVVRADYLLRARVPHPDGGERPVREILRDEADQRREIEQETSNGSRKHQRLAPWMRLIPKLVLLFDFCLLLYFFAGITDVNWSSPLSMSLGFAIALDAMVTVLSYGFLSFTGHRLRSHKNDDGAAHFDELDGHTKAAAAIALAVIAVISALMFIRMHTEVLLALGPQAGVTALIIGLAVAVVSAVANYLVIAIHQTDGSDQVARLDKLSAAVRRHAAKAHRLRERAARHADGDRS